jgi:tetrathionate reductase subunit B
MMAKQKLVMLADTERCVNCKACEVACRAEWNTPLGVSRNWVREVMSIANDGAPRLSLIPGRCQHCDDAPCVDDCPSGASFKREDGIVLVDDSLCSGCALCQEVCPYDARFLDPVTDTMSKCTFCQPRIDTGEQPACVTTCFNKALIFGDANDPNSEVAKLLKEGNWTKLITDEVDTGPNHHYLAGTDFDESVLPKKKLGTIQARLTDQIINPGISTGLIGMSGLFLAAGIAKIVKRRDEVSEHEGENSND